MTANEWRDIESAPKDGTRVLLVRVDVPTMHTAFWRDGRWRCGSMDYFNKPTHWMPLPPPPVPSGEGMGVPVHDVAGRAQPAEASPSAAVTR